MSNRERDQQAEQERLRQEEAQRQQQEQMNSPRDLQPGDDETSTSPIIINR